VSSLRDAIASAVDSTVARCPDWTDRLPADVREELHGIRRDWLAGKLQASGRGLAAAIVANCKQRGIAVIKTSGVREWLTRVR
jgi:hypothetical protein